LYRHAAIVTLSLALLSCAAILTEEQVGMNEPIEMGPWTFEVKRASAQVDMRGNTPFKTVTVILKLHNYRERHEKPFDDFLNGRSPKSLMDFPHLHLVDESGTKFDVESISPMSGGSLRSERWRAGFLLVPSNLGFNRSASDAAAEHLDKRPSDFRLVFKNPDRRETQAALVSVQLK
jgi:hypothetical protein